MQGSQVMRTIRLGLFVIVPNILLSHILRRYEVEFGLLLSGIAVDIMRHRSIYHSASLSRETIFKKLY